MKGWLRSLGGAPIMMGCTENSPEEAEWRRSTALIVGSFVTFVCVPIAIHWQPAGASMALFRRRAIVSLILSPIWVEPLAREAKASPCSIRGTPAPVCRQSIPTSRA
jgi:hypothetical protein